MNKQIVETKIENKLIQYKIPLQESRQLLIQANRVQSKQQNPIDYFHEDLDRVYPLRPEIEYRKQIENLVEHDNVEQNIRTLLISMGRTSFLYYVKIIDKNNVKPMKRLAGKVIDLKLMPDDLVKQIYDNELNILRTSDNSNIIQFYSYVEIKEEKLLIIFMEFCQWNLQIWAANYEKEISLTLKKHWCYQVIQAISYLHCEGWAHRDLRASDVIIFDDGRVKICDFTHSKFCKMNDQVVLQRKTTNDIQYLAPEYFYNEFADPFKADCFSLGIIVYIILFRQYPFGFYDTSTCNVNEQKQIFYSRIINKVYRPVDQSKSNNLNQLINGLLEPNPDDRMTADEALLSNCLLIDDAETYVQLMLDLWGMAE